MTRRTLFLVGLLIFLFYAHPYIQGANSFRRVKSQTFVSGAVNFNGRSKDFDVDGSEDHSIAWDLDAASSLTVQLGFPNASGTLFYVTPAELGNGQSNPLVIGGPGSGAAPLFVPVSPTIRIVVTGTSNGIIVFNDS